MALVLTILLLGVNFFISWSNAAYVGRYWSESKEVGGSFRRHVVCGYVMAISGFTMVYAYILLLSVSFFMRLCDVDGDLIAQFEQLGSDLTYLLVGVSIILSGFRIWISSLRAAWEERSFAHIATAGWNSYAQIHNVVSFGRHAPSAFGRVVDVLFSDGKSGSKGGKKSKETIIIILAIIIIVLAILGGYFTANAIMKRADAEYDMFEQVAHKREYQ